MSRAASAHLRAADPAMARLIAEVGPCRLVVQKIAPYESLVRSISHQQLHGNAARAIMGRFVALYPDHTFPPPEAVLATEDAALRATGLSASKIATIRGLAAAALDGTIPTRARAARLSDAVLIERLTALRGVGRWTVEMLLMFCLGRPDVLPVDDFGVREGYRRLHGLDVQPRPRELAALGEAWAPYRSAAAWYLWRAAEAGKSVKQPS
ncbi:MAG: DNA-3-methyladenine glycosylase 2 family protein [Acidisphaera sp.]|nr:DNA-3-methyladenine glycosylase 2 family protein [Acidisphaera sp.]MBV9813190.1 DNA-3-methyladenine glycosylase 2 family protein [Acetobacteraceae bacterium]